ncbi:MAG: hypothetical protein AB7P69_24495 [Candidatus Binatia bacterium]
MKNYHTFWDHMKQNSKRFKHHSKRIVTNTVLAGVLILSGKAAEANPVAGADFNGDEYINLSVSAPDEQVSLAMLSQGHAASVNSGMYQAKAAKGAVVQLFSDMSIDNFQPNAYPPAFLLQHTRHSTGKYESKVTVDADGFLVMFSW